MTFAKAGFAPSTRPSAGPPAHPAYWRPSDDVISDWPAPLTASVAGTSDSVFAEVASAAETHFELAPAEIQVLPSSYVSTPTSHVYLKQKLGGLPILNTQLHVVVAGSPPRILRANSSFANLKKFSAKAALASTPLTMHEAATAAYNTFNGNAGVWLGDDFVQRVQAEGTALDESKVTGFGNSGGSTAELGWYLVNDGADIVKAWQFNTSKCSLIVDALSGQIIGFNSFLAE
ncbi:hypothetical protein HDU81_005561 [Chytriomyces hyalinus]|nr:hypothetical protein HDU81_005561 [Chytriomyces hyalinus]